MSWLPDFLKNLATANYGMWNSPEPGLHPDGSVTPGEGGVDIGTPNGTPVYAIADGKVVASGYWKDSGHGVVTTRINVPGAGPQDLYYQHIQIDPAIKTGQTVHRGQLIGKIGPYNEIEMGFNAAWGGVWGANHPGPWIKDPRPWIKATLNSNPSTPSGDTSSTSTFDNPLSGLTDPLSGALTTIKHWGEYIAVFALALILLIMGFVLLTGSTPQGIAKKAAGL